MDKKHINDIFMDYVSGYDIRDPKIVLKMKHTCRVAALSEQIARSLRLSEEDTDLAWLIGMLHDIGRFEQVRRYHTFRDADSVNHAALSADLLFSEGLIERFVKIRDDETRQLIETAVRLHNAYMLPEGMSGRLRLFCQIIRDADKVDILRVMCETPFTDIYDISWEAFLKTEISDEVYADIMAGRTVDRSHSRTAIDYRIGHIALVFGLVYEESRRLALMQGSLSQLMDFESEDPVTRERMIRIREKVRAHMMNEI